MNTKGINSIKVYLFFCLVLTLSMLFSSCLKWGGNPESYYETYDGFKKNWDKLAGHLPENSTGIRHYSVLDFDTNYHFIEATARIEDLDIFVKSKNYFDSELNYFDVPYSDRRFDSLFYKKPAWWNEENLYDYEQSVLILFSDDKNYGRGCWFFYNEDVSTIRVFIWLQQWRSLEDVKKILL